MTANNEMDSARVSAAVARPLRAQLIGLRVGVVVVLALLLAGAVAFALHERQRVIADIDRETRQLADEMAAVLATTLDAAGTAVGELDRLLQTPAPAGQAPWPALAARGGASLARLLAAQRLPVDLLLVDAGGRRRGLDGQPLDGVTPVPADLRPGHWLPMPPSDAQPGRPLPLWRAAAANPHGIVAYRLTLHPQQLLDTMHLRQVGSAGLLLARVEPDASTLLLARAPHDPSVVGLKVAGQLAARLRETGDGTYHAVTPVDGVVRVIGFRRLEGDAQRLVVAYGLPDEDVMTRWHDLLPGLALTTLLVAGLLVLGGWRLEGSLRDLARSQEAVAQRERQLRTLTANLPDVVVRLDEHGRHLFASPAIERATGLPPEAFLGKTYTEMGMDPALVRQWTDTLARALEVGRTQRVDFRFPGPQGPRDWESLVVPEPPEPGQPRSALVISRDITKRLEAENQIRRLAQELEQRVQDRTAELDDSLARLRQVNQELQTFTYSVSHDLKAPLRGIDGYSRLLLQDHAASLDAEGQRFLGHIRDATQHMGRLIDDLLAYSRLERREPALRVLALAPAVSAVTAVFDADLRERGASLTTDVPADLLALGDAQGFAMALRNLVDNALKFARPGVPAQVRVSAQRVAGHVRVIVQDNGLGFDMKFHDRIFTIFQRLQRAEDYPGTGVGLAIVRKAMERMGGRVWGESRPGEGATFTMELPEAP